MGTAIPLVDTTTPPPPPIETATTPSDPAPYVVIGLLTLTVTFAPLPRPLMLLTYCNALSDNMATPPPPPIDVAITPGAALPLVTMLPSTVTFTVLALDPVVVAPPN